MHNDIQIQISAISISLVNDGYNTWHLNGEVFSSLYICSLVMLALDWYNKDSIQLHLSFLVLYLLINISTFKDFFFPLVQAGVDNVYGHSPEWLLSWFSTFLIKWEAIKRGTLARFSKLYCLFQAIQMSKNNIKEHGKELYFCQVV